MDKNHLKTHIKKMTAGYCAVEKVNEEELANLSHEDVMEITRRLFSVNCNYENPDNIAYSGLVDFQSYLRKMRV